MNFPGSRFPKPQQSQIDAIFKTYKPQRILEVGSYEGLSTTNYANMALSNSNESIELTCIDTWEGGQEHIKEGVDMKSVETIFDRNMISLNAAHKNRIFIRKIKNNSTNALAMLYANREKYFDLVLIDAGHKAQEVLGDMVFSWPLLKPGGILIADDYLWRDQNSSDILDYPKIGIDSFINSYYKELVVLSNAPLQQIYIYKKDPTFPKNGFNCVFAPI